MVTPKLTQGRLAKVAAYPGELWLAGWLMEMTSTDALQETPGLPRPEPSCCGKSACALPLRLSLIAPSGEEGMRGQ